MSAAPTLKSEITATHQFDDGRHIMSANWNGPAQILLQGQREDPPHEFVTSLSLPSVDFHDLSVAEQIIPEDHYIYDTAIWHNANTTYSLASTEQRPTQNLLMTKTSGAPWTKAKVDDMSAFANHPDMQGDKFNRLPHCIAAMPINDRITCVVLSDPQAIRVPRYIALLQRDVFGKHEWISGLTQMTDHTAITDLWRPGLGSDYLMITGFTLVGDTLYLSSRGGRGATFSNAAPYETSILARFRITTKPDPAISFLDAIALPEGQISPDIRGAYIAVKLHRKNTVLFFRPSQTDPFARLGLTAKQSLGTFRHQDVSLRFSGTQMVVCHKTGVAVCSVPDLA